MISDILLYVFNVFIGVIGIAFALVIIVGVGKVCVNVLLECASYIWETIHKSSYENFKNKWKEKRNKNKDKK